MVSATVEARPDCGLSRRPIATSYKGRRVSEQTFRLDLYYRLDVFFMKLPALRGMKCSLLVDHYCSRPATAALTLSEIRETLLRCCFTAIGQAAMRERALRYYLSAAIFPGGARDALR